uniref:Uncharacterized protein n=1 Tax=Rangifer tarandus platyrhynchus TaxID=3082113 RepID=A0ACB0EMY6_RANTA|nr:unnamed protein product [Rangifer tarandus platyrhynchus]
MLPDPKELRTHRGGMGRAHGGDARAAAAALPGPNPKKPLALRAPAPLPGELVCPQTLGCYATELLRRHRALAQKIQRGQTPPVLLLKGVQGERTEREEKIVDRRDPRKRRPGAQQR